MAPIPDLSYNLVASFQVVQPVSRQIPLVLFHVKHSICNIL